MVVAATEIDSQQEERAQMPMCQQMSMTVKEERQAQVWRTPKTAGPWPDLAVLC